MIQLFTDEQILDAAFRKKIIDEIEGQENVNRKKLQAAIWEIWRDQIRKFVLERLEKQGFKPETLAIMNQRASNVNLFKKIVSKKARSYSKGCNRSVQGKERETKDLEVFAKILKLNHNMKRVDRYRKAAKNCIMYIYPELVDDPLNSELKYHSLCTKVFFPHLYDVIPDAKDKEKPRCVILSPFTDESSRSSEPDIGSGDGRGILSFSNPIWQRDYIDQQIANSPRDSGANKKEYIFWTSKYHLTCDRNGLIKNEKTPEGFKNPINRLPFINFAEEQDGEFWALGGDDLVEATILINLKLTDMESILHMQGWGQLVISGENVEEKDYKIGPQHALTLSTPKGSEFETKASILQHDPHTDDHLKSTEVHVALVLTTNNLSVKSVSTNLETSSVASAIAKMVDESENLDDVSEDQEYYAAKEKEIFAVAESWAKVYRPIQNTLPELKKTAEIPIKDVTIQFHKQEQVVTETERLNNLKIRKELGLDTMVDLIKRDNPSFTEDQALKKALEVMNQNVAMAEKARSLGITLPTQTEEEPEEEPEEMDDSEDPEETEE